MLYYEGTVEDVTERVRAEAAEREQRTLAEALRETAETLNSSLDYGSVLEKILSIAGRVVPNDTATVILIEDGQLKIVGSHGYKERGLSPEKALSALNLQEPGNLKQIFESREPVVIPDVSAYPHWKMLPGTEWLRSNIGAPLIIQDSVIGFLLLDSETPGFFSPLHAQRLQAFASQAALAIENARLFEKTQQLAAFNQNIIQSMTEGIVIENGDGVFNFANPEALKLLGYTSEELSGMHWTDVIPADQQAIVQAADERRMRGEADRYEVDLLRKDGQRISVLVSGSPQFDADGKTNGTMAVFTDITERVQAEEVLRQSEERFRSLVEQSSDGIAIIDEQGSIIEWNQKNEQIMGLNRADAVGQSIWDVQYRVLPELIKNTAIRKQFKTDTLAFMANDKILVAKQMELDICHTDDIKRTIQMSIFKFNIDKKWMGCSISRDVTERRLMETSLRESEERYRTLVDQIPDIVYIDDISAGASKTQFVSPYIEQMLGFTPEEWIAGGYELWKECLHPEDRERVLAEYENAIQNDKMLNCEYRLSSKDGQIVWVMDRATLLHDEEDKPRSLHGMIHDITAQMKVETEIKQRVSELETLHENGLLISGLLEPKKIAQALVEVLEQKLDWHHVAIRQYHLESDHLELLALNQPGLSKAQMKKQVKHLNESIRTPDQGLSGWVVRHGQPVRCNRGLSEDPRYVDTYPGLNSGLYVPIRIGDRIIGSIAVESEDEDAFTEQDERLLLTLANQSAIALDNARLYLQLQQELKERSNAEEQVRKFNIELEGRVAERTAEIESAQHRFELAASAAGIGIWELKSGNVKVYWDERLHKIYGTSPGEFQPTITNWIDFVYPEDRLLVEEKRAQAIEEGTPYENEFRIVKADGSMRYISSRAIVLHDKEQKIKDMIGVDMDVTPIKLAEETLRMGNMELERALRVKDEFLANMSHELRTPLNAILGLSESLEEQIAGPLNDKQSKYLHTISESGHHLLELINDILDLAKIEAGQIALDMNKVNLQLLCQASTRMVIQMAQKKEQELTVEIDERIDLVWADERRLKQMIVNLLSNAVKFTPQGGRLGIKIQAEPSDNSVLNRGLG